MHKAGSSLLVYMPLEHTCNLDGSIILTFPVYYFWVYFFGAVKSCRAQMGQALFYLHQLPVCLSLVEVRMVCTLGLPLA